MATNPNQGHLPRAPENVRLGSFLHDSSTHNFAAAETHNGPSFSQAPTLAPSGSDTSSQDGEKSGQHKRGRGGDAMVDMPNEKAMTYNEKTGQPISIDPQEQEGIDVARSKAQFAELSRQLSQASSLHRARSRASQSGASASVVEAGEKDDEEEFDLAQEIKGGADARHEQGFKNKQVGVVWQGLKVQGAGGLKVGSRWWTPTQNPI